MKRSVGLAFILGLLVVLSGPLTAYAQNSDSWYFELKPGAYVPTGDLKDKNFDTMFNAELAVGRHYNPNLVFEAGVGYFHDSTSSEGLDGRITNEIWVIPVTGTVKGILPIRRIELTAGAGVGLYFSSLEETVATSEAKVKSDDNGVALGGHVLAGFNINLSRDMFIGAEGKYLVTTGASLFSEKVNMNGYTISGILGWRL